MNRFSGLAVRCSSRSVCRRTRRPSTVTRRRRMWVPTSRIWVRRETHPAGTRRPAAAARPAVGTVGPPDGRTGPRDESGTGLGAGGTGAGGVGGVGGTGGSGGTSGQYSVVVI